MLSFEEILAAAFEYEEVAFRLKDMLASNLVVANPFHRQIGEFLSDFIDKHNRLPTTSDVELWANHLSEKQKKGVIKALSQIQQQDISDYSPEIIAEYGAQELQNIGANNVLNRLNQAREEEGQIDREMFEAVSEDLAELEPITLAETHNLRDVGKHLRPEKQEEGIPTGVKKLDNWIGGWNEGELSFLMADTGVGKSISLVNFGVAAARHGSKVLHVTLEMSDKKTDMRYYRRITTRNRDEIQNELDDARKEVRYFWDERVEGDIYVHQEEPYELTPSELRALVQMYDRRHGNIDLILLDYLDLMKPPQGTRNRGQYEQLGMVAHRVRAIGQEYDAAVVSAAQAQRPNNQEYVEELYKSNMGDSYKKVRAGDQLLGLVQTPDEEENNQARVQILKVRDRPGSGGQFPVYFNKDRMYLGGLDHHDTERIKREEGDEVFV